MCSVTGSDCQYTLVLDSVFAIRVILKFCIILIKSLSGNFTCSCIPDYTGRRCETQVNDCSPLPCYNNGQCVDGIASFMCNCPRPFTGQRCEGRIKECLYLPCQNNGTCVEGTGSSRYSCVCPATFTGMSVVTYFTYPLILLQKLPIGMLIFFLAARRLFFY